MKKLILFFIDGLGLGPEDPAVNPMRSLFAGLLGGPRFVRRHAPYRFPGGVLVPTDAVMGVPGIPQSATGQTSLFTGVNAQAFIGAHLSAYPNAELRRLIEERSLMKALARRGVRTTAANLYSREFFLSRRNSRRNLFPVSTLTIKASGSRFRYPADYAADRAVFADITNELIRSRGYDIDLIRPEQAAGRMLNILEDFDFVFFEYFMTDLHGHKRDAGKLARCVEILNAFMGEIWRGMDRRRAAVLVVSDHGNAEDIRTGDHTLNPVPTLLLSEDPGAQSLFADSVSDLTDVYRAVIAYYSLPD